MTEQTVAMYCFIDDLLPAIRPNSASEPDPRQHLSDAQVLTTALVAARFFGGNLTAAQLATAQRYMQGHWGQRTLHKSGLSRQLHQLRDVLDELREPAQRVVLVGADLSAGRHHVADVVLRVVAQPRGLPGRIDYFRQPALPWAS